MSHLIAVDRISFIYPTADLAAHPPKVLEDVTFEIGEGEFIAILGANGSGKTTLARHLNGLLQPTEGRVLVGEMDTRDPKQHGRIRQQVGMVFQHPEDQIVATTVEEDVAFGPENLGLEPDRIRRRVDEAIEAVGLQAHRFRPPHLLSAGQMQRLALAGVLAMRPRCVVFDEATTMLDPAGRKMALELMDSLRSEGLTVVFVTHNMEEAALATRVIVLQRGKLVFDGLPLDAFSSERLAEWGLEPPPAVELARRLGRCLPGLDATHLDMESFLQALPPWTGGIAPLVPPVMDSSLGLPVLRVAGLEHVYLRDTPLAHTALAGVDLDVFPGRVHGLAGVTGSGKSTLLQHLNGLLRPQKGSVSVGALKLEDPRTLTRDIVKRVGLVFQNPEMQFFETFVGDEIAYGPRQLALQKPLRDHVRYAMEIVGLDFEAFKDRLVFKLSGGERRKVALASVLANRPEILLLDEPTAGLDPQSHHEILARLGRLSVEGTQLVISSHRMDDLAMLAQDLTVFQKGRSLFSGPAENFFNHSDDLYAAGLEPPTAVRAANRLRDLGWPVPVNVVNADELERALARCGGGER